VASAALPMSMQGFRIAVMIQVSSGIRAYARSCPSSDARVSGKPRGSISGDPHAVTPPPPTANSKSAAEIGSMIETAIARWDR